MTKVLRNLCCAGIGSLMASTALADSACGNTYVIEPGETLYRVSQTCDVPLSRIMDLNPDVNPRSLEVGSEIRVAAAASGDDAGPATRDYTDRDRARVQAEAEGYRIRPGDTMYSVAQALGVSLVELMQANADVDPFSLIAGNLLDVPAETERFGAVRVRPDEAAPGRTVTLRAYGLRPDDWVTVGAGRMDSTWSRLREVRVDGDGTLVADVTVPDWAEAGEDLVFVVNTDRGVTYKSSRFAVVAASDNNDAPDDKHEVRERTLEGEVRMGVECHILRTADGDRWALVSDRVAFTEGEYVEVTGPRAEASVCQEGIGTINVEVLSEVDRPRSDDGMMLEGRVRMGTECYTLTTPDGDVWSLVSSDIPFTQGEYVEVTGGRADASYCMQGIGTMDVEKIEEVEPRGG